MSNITKIEKPLSMLEEAKKAAAEQVAKETLSKAKDALLRKYRELDGARKIVANVEREIADLESSIEDGSFV